ncbi:hypothetical protein Lal_00023738 [Lupinus albus]|uniref:Putative dynein ATPase n=1 Tax=Lupinus albus TaxID=3870 RepID=A0A6A4PIT0_LUPAL|nr:putative dynein ATPase [Lupinus albus]KAF1887731.1 hypothetical protein Lal_00023738 [Lupinus albus]
MSQRTTLKKNLTASESKPSSTDSDMVKYSSDLTQPYKPSFIVKHLSNLNLSNSQKHKQKHQQQSQTKQKHQQPHHPLLVDTRFQARAMSTSAIVEPSKYSSLKPNPEKERTTMKRALRDNKPRSKVQGLLKNEKIDFHNKKMVEDVKIEKSHDDDDDDDVIKRSSVSMAPSGVRRISFSGSQVDLRDAFAINGVKMVSADMAPFMQIHAVDCARKALDSMEKFTSKTLALSLKKEFDGVYGPAWHCIVGTSFGSFVTHSVGGFLYFSMDQKLYILLFKTAVQKAD